MWSNWARTQACVPVAIERPKSAREVGGAVRRAAEAGRTVRAAGAVLYRARLDGVRLIEADLGDSDLSRARLKRTVLDGTQLAGATLAAASGTVWGPIDVGAPGWSPRTSP